MDINWNLYNKRLTVNGNTTRERDLNNLKQTLINNIPQSLSCKDVIINKLERKLVINSSTSQNIKTIQTLPNETLLLGNYVEWNAQYWLVTKADVDDEVYIDGEMKLCNWIIKFQDDEGMLYEYPCIDSGSSGSGEDKSKIMTYGKTVHTITIPYDEITIKLRSTDIKSCRFYLDRDIDNPIPYKVIDIDSTSLNYSKKGLIVLTLEQDVTQDTDRPDLGICNYFEPTTTPAPQPNQSGILYNSKITYLGDSKIQIGGSIKTFTATFTKDGVEENISPLWTVTTVPEFNQYIHYSIIDKSIRIKADNYVKMDKSQIKLEVKDTDGNYYSSIFIDIVTGV